MANPKIEVEIGAKISSLQNALADSESQLNKFSRSAVQLGKVFSLAVTAPILAFGAAAVKSASDAEETFSKFDTVFRDIAQSSNEAFTALRDSYGLSNRAAKELLGNTGDLLTGFGFSQKAALDLSTEVNKLAVDLASFTNFSGGAKGASEALTKALLGERESVKALGISILEEDVKKQVAINTAKGLIFETERQAKAYATLDIAVSQSQNAIGDYERTQDSFANQTRLLQARVEDLSASFGEILLPAATSIVNGVNKVVNSFLSLDEQTRKTIVIVSGIAAAIGPLSLAIGGLIQALPLLAAGFTALTGPIGLISAAVVGLGILIATNFDQILFDIKVLSLGFIDTSINIIRALNTISSSIPGFTAVTTGAIGALQVFGKEIAESLVSNLGEKTTDAVDGLKDNLSGLNTVFEGVGNSGEMSAKKVLDAFTDERWQEAEDNALKLARALNQLTPDFSGSQDGVSTGNFDPTETAEEAPSFANKFQEQANKIQGIISSLSEAFTGLGAIIGKAFNNTGLGQFVGEFLRFSAKIVAGAFAVAKANAIAGATQSSLFTGPAAAFTLPAFIAGAVGLVASAFAGIGGGSGGGGGGGSVGSSFSGSTFEGSGATGFSSNRELTGELVVRGQDLVYVFGQAQTKIAKG